MLEAEKEGRLPEWRWTVSDLCFDRPLRALRPNLRDRVGMYLGENGIFLRVNQFRRMKPWYEVNEMSGKMIRKENRHHTMSRRRGDWRLT